MPRARYSKPDYAISPMLWKPPCLKTALTDRCLTRCFSWQMKNTSMAFTVTLRFASRSADLLFSMCTIFRYHWWMRWISPILSMRASIFSSMPLHRLAKTMCSCWIRQERSAGSTFCHVQVNRVEHIPGGPMIPARMY